MPSLASDGRRARATDTEYKPGADMVHGQYLFDDGSDLQLGAVPRPAYRGGNPTSNASSAAAHFRIAIGMFQTSLLLAHDHGDAVAGLGINGPLGGATYQWTPLVEIAPTLIANLDDRSLYGLARATWSLNDNLTLIGGAQIPIGPSRSEFGGLPVSGGNAPYLEQPTRIYVQLRQYF